MLTTKGQLYTYKILWQLQAIYKTNPVNNSSPAVVPGQVKVPCPVNGEKRRNQGKENREKREQMSNERDIEKDFRSRNE